MTIAVAEPTPPPLRDGTRRPRRVLRRGQPCASWRMSQRGRERNERKERRGAARRVVPLPPPPPPLRQLSGGSICGAGAGPSGCARSSGTAPRPDGPGGVPRHCPRGLIAMPEQRRGGGGRDGGRYPMLLPASHHHTFTMLTSTSAPPPLTSTSPMCPPPSPVHPPCATPSGKPPPSAAGKWTAEAPSGAVR